MANIKELIQSIESTDSSFDEKLDAINKMEETLVALRQQEEKAVQDNVDLIVEAIKVMENKVTAQLEIAKSIVPEKGDKGDKGLDGKQGKDGRDGKDGKDGINGKDGADGKDGVSVSNAQIDFDGSLVITLSTGQEINVGEVVAPELQERIKLVTSGGAGTVLPTQTGNANKYLKTDGSALSWDALNGSDIDLSTPPTIGNTTPNTGAFTTLIGGGGSANYGQLTGGATTKAVEFQTLGSDSNIALVLDTKGTGAIDLAAGSSGVNISNGGTVTAITRTAGGSGYTVAPTVTISAPTTAGGVQATATCTVTAGVVDTAFTITNAGSGYVEQPTITFTPVSGGSGATAYATVGSAPKLTSLHRYLDTYASGGQVARFDSGFYTGVALTDFLSLLPSNFGGPTLLADNTSGSGNLNLRLSSSGTSAIDFFTNRTGQRQLQVSHTASAVNYVQVTGGATGNPSSVTISAQGSDANVNLALTSKGTGSVRISNAGTIAAPSFSIGASNRGFYDPNTGEIGVVGGGWEQFRFGNTSSSVNYLKAAGNAAGSAPTLSSQGSDTDIDLTLTPKGAGAVRFGTYTGTILTPTGYITIKDSGGTTRRLLVG